MLIDGGYSENNFETTTEGIFGYEFHRTNPWSSTTTDQIFESDTQVIDGAYILYGMGGILVFFIVYTLCYGYFMHLKESAERRRTELSRLNERLARIAFDYPNVRDGRVIIENVNETNRSTNERTRVKGSSWFNRTSPTNQTAGDASIFEPRQSCSRTLQSEASNVPEGHLSSNNTLTHGSVSSGSVYLSYENVTKEQDTTWMSEPPLCFSSPKESEENLFFQNNPSYQSLENDAQTEKYNSSKVLEKDGNITPSKKDGRLTPPPPEGRSKSSPTSPDIVRRRLLSSDENAPRRPSSWR